MEDAPAAALFVFLLVSGAVYGAAVVAVLAGLPQPRRAAGRGGKDWRGDLAGQHLRGSRCGLPAQSVPEESCEQRKNLPPRFVGLFAASELFFRVDDLGRLRRFRAGLAVGLARADFAGADALFPP